jgi:hypothetical protein
MSSKPNARRAKLSDDRRIARWLAKEREEAELVARREAAHMAKYWPPEQVADLMKQRAIVDKEGSAALAYALLLIYQHLVAQAHREHEP